MHRARCAATLSSMSIATQILLQPKNRLEKLMISDRVAYLSFCISITLAKLRCATVVSQHANKPGAQSHYHPCMLLGTKAHNFRGIRRIYNPAPNSSI
jgi:hypothetical protein